jgi:hypothetical protein
MSLTIDTRLHHQ